MDSTDLFVDAAHRPLDTVGTVLAGIDTEALHARPLGRGNSIAWLVWHAGRQMDAQLAHLATTDQVWTAGDWATRLGIDRGPREIGFGDTAEKVAALKVADPDLLQDYYRTVTGALTDYVAGLSPADLDQVVDTHWDPPVTRGARLISIIDDAVTHVGQAAYARGLVQDWSIGY